MAQLREEKEVVKPEKSLKKAKKMFRKGIRHITDFLKVKKYLDPQRLWESDESELFYLTKEK